MCFLLVLLSRFVPNGLDGMLERESRRRQLTTKPLVFFTVGVLLAGLKERRQLLCVWGAEVVAVFICDASKGVPARHLRPAASKRSKVESAEP